MGGRPARLRANESDIQCLINLNLYSWPSVYQILIRRRAGENEFWRHAETVLYDSRATVMVVCSATILIPISTHGSGISHGASTSGGKSSSGVVERELDQTGLVAVTRINAAASPGIDRNLS
jgi:hypothetical protein